MRRLNTSDMNPDDLFRAYKRQLIARLGRDALYASDIDSIGRVEFGKRWGGASAQASWKPRRNMMYIVNTAVSDRSPGSHWMAVYASPRGTVYAYDSFGRSPRRLLHRVGRTAAAWGAGELRSESVPDAEQRGSSAVCGHLSLAWLLVVRDLGVRAALTI